MARSDFIALDNVWRRSSLTWRRKIAIFGALVESKLLYGLITICLTVAQERRLNGFQNRCLRSIIGVEHSFVSRISNAEVIRRADHPLATELLRKRQLHLLGKVLRSSESHPLRTATFNPGTNHPLTERYVRRRGRPCKEWLPTVQAEAIRIFGSMAAVEAKSQDKNDWNQILREYIVRAIE